MLCTVPQANNVARKLQHANSASVAVSASALGSKDSLYTIQDAPAAPTHRITAAPVQVGGSSGWGEDGLQRLLFGQLLGMQLLCMVQPCSRCSAVGTAVRHAVAS